MKLTLLFSLIILFQFRGFAQCNCKVLNHDDGHKSVQCYPKPIGGDNSVQIGLAAASNGEIIFVQMMVRFRNNSQKVTTDLKLRLQDDNVVNLKLLKTEFAEVNNSQVCNALYSLTEDQKAKLINSKIVTATFKLADGKVHSIEAKMYADVLSEQLDCL